MTLRPASRVPFFPGSDNVPGSTRRPGAPDHPWRAIDLDVYEQHMGDPGVGQLQGLHAITGEQLAAYSARTIAVLGIAGGNGLDLIDPETTDAVYGYDVNPDYLAACELRYRRALGSRLHLIETRIDRSLTVEPVDILIANLVIEYVGMAEFVAFAAANARSIGVLSSVIQRNSTEGFVSSTAHSASFAALASVSSDIDPETLSSAMSARGFLLLADREYPLPNGKALVRQDFRMPRRSQGPAGRGSPGRPRRSSGAQTARAGGTPGSVGRALLRMPVGLYRLRLGRLLGRRFVLLTHRGRKSGRLYRTVLEVVRYDARQGEVVVMSGFGERANWYRNIIAGGAVSVQLGGERFIPTVRLLEPDEAAAALADYEERNRLAAPLVRRVLARLAGLPYDGSDVTRRALVERLPLVGFRTGECEGAPPHLKSRASSSL